MFAISGHLQNCIGLMFADKRLLQNCIGLMFADNGLLQNCIGLMFADTSLLQNCMGLMFANNGLLQNCIGLMFAYNGLMQNCMGLMFPYDGNIESLEKVLRRCGGVAGSRMAVLLSRSVCAKRDPIVGAPLRGATHTREANVFPCEGRASAIRAYYRRGKHRSLRGARLGDSRLLSSCEGVFAFTP